MTNEKYVNDAAMLGDGFGSTAAGDQVARMALEVQTPFTIGVTGKWGAGKTSVLRRAFATLGGEPIQLERPFGEAKTEADREQWKKWSVEEMERWKSLNWLGNGAALRQSARNSLCVWFSPWQHQQAENPLVALLLEIRSQLTLRLRLRGKLSNLNQRGGEAAVALLERSADAVASLWAKRSLKVAGGTTDAVRDAWRRAAPPEPGLDDGQRFQLLFEQAVDMALDGVRVRGQKEPGRLVIFVDDLDRCEEDRIVQLLESIKLYLSSPRCVFVLGLDDAAVLSALERQWQGRSPDANREYLEKLFQATLPVAMPEPDRVRDFVADQLRAHDFEEVDACAKMIEEIVEPNPRKIKNFVNSVCASWALYRPARAQAEGLFQNDFERCFILFQYLRRYHKPVWRLLENQRMALRVLTMVLTGGTVQSMMLPEPQDGDPDPCSTLDADEQRMIKSLMIRAFAHVLKDQVNRTGNDDEWHHFMPIAEAVALMRERVDRKRSDERFKYYYDKLLEPDVDLPACFLHLPIADHD